MLAIVERANCAIELSLDKALIFKDIATRYSCSEELGKPSIFSRFVL